MKIKYSNTKEEMYRYNVDQFINSAELAEETKRMKKVYGILAVMVAVVGVFLIVKGLGVEDDAEKVDAISKGASFVLMGLVTFTFSWLYRLVRIFFTKRDLKKKDYVEDEVELNIDQKAINWAFRNNKGVIRQTEDIKIRDTTNDIVVITRKHTFIIPKRIFNEETLAEFKEAINYDKRVVTTAK